MPRGMFKSGRLRKIFVKTPGGKTTVHYRQESRQRQFVPNVKNS